MRATRCGDPHERPQVEVEFVERHRFDEVIPHTRAKGPDRESFGVRQRKHQDRQAHEPALEVLHDPELPAIRVVEVEAQEPGSRRARSAAAQFRGKAGIARLRSVERRGFAAAPFRYPTRSRTTAGAACRYPGSCGLEDYCRAGLRGRVERRPLNPKAPLSPSLEPPPPSRVLALPRARRKHFLTYLYRLPRCLVKPAGLCQDIAEAAGRAG